MSFDDYKIEIERQNKEYHDRIRQAHILYPKIARERGNDKLAEMIENDDDRLSFTTDVSFHINQIGFVRESFKKDFLGADDVEYENAATKQHRHLEMDCKTQEAWSEAWDWKKVSFTVPQKTLALIAVGKVDEDKIDCVLCCSPRVSDQTLEKYRECMDVVCEYDDGSFSFPASKIGSNWMTSINDVSAFNEAAISQLASQTFDRIGRRVFDDSIIFAAPRNEHYFKENIEVKTNAIVKAMLMGKEKVVLPNLHKYLNQRYLCKTYLNSGDWKKRALVPFCLSANDFPEIEMLNSIVDIWNRTCLKTDIAVKMKWDDFSDQAIISKKLFDLGSALSIDTFIDALLNGVPSDCIVLPGR